MRNTKGTQAAESGRDRGAPCEKVAFHGVGEAAEKPGGKKCRGRKDGGGTQEIGDG